MRFEHLRFRRKDGYVFWSSRLYQSLAFAAAGTVGRIHSCDRPRLQYSPTPLYLVQTNRRRSKVRLLGHILALLLLFCTFSLIFPPLALAWGPGVHMITGNWVLQNLATLPPLAAEALMRFPGQYLHGTLSADIFIGKGSKAKEGHSHNWNCGFSLLSKADNLRRQAYALGYLSHLAADTVAHNVYVPGTFNTAPGSRRLAHVYIEMQSDASLKWDSLDARGVFHEAGSLASERILRETIRQKAWMYWLKKHVYESSIAIGGSNRWRSSMAFMNRLFPGEERLDMLDYMLTLSTRGIMSVLKDLDNSPVLKFDPIGADALALAVTRRSGPGLIIGSLKNIIKKPAPVIPNMEWATPVPKEPEINIIVPELMQNFPQVCLPEGFVARQNNPEPA